MAAGTPAIEIGLARPEDDPELRRILRDNPMPGGIALTLQREPAFHLGATIEGDRHDVVVGRMPESGRVVGLGSYSVRDAFVNGERTRLGYLSQLRIDPAFRGRWLLGRGYKAIRACHEAPLAITTVFAENERARALLELDRPPKPSYRRRGVLCTLGVPVRRRGRPRAASRAAVRPAARDDVEAIAACLQRNLQRYQFAPVWTAADLLDGERTRGLAPTDFFVVTDGERVAGCVALWDQQAYKQTVVHGYRGALRLARPVLNCAAALSGWPRLPAPGQTLGHAYVSHLAVDDDDPAIARALLTAVYRAAGGRYAFLTVGLTDRHPLLAVLKGCFWHLEYRSILYVTFWDDGAAAAAALDDRAPHVETAVL